MDLRTAFEAALRAALGEDAAAIPDFGRMISQPPRPDMGDLAFGCFPLAKARRMAPAQIAADLAERLEVGGMIGRVVAAGPFVNVFANPVGLLNDLAAQLVDGRFDAALKTETPQRIMVEFSQPNTHKTFHVGHLRNVVLGDSITRILKARGHDVVPVNYFGDFGIDVAKCLWWLRTQDVGEAPEEGRTAWLGSAYAAANHRLAPAEDDDDAMTAQRVAWRAEVREVLRGMEEKDPEIFALYEKTRQWCLDEFADIYAWLHVAFDHDFFESTLDEPAQAVVSEYLEKGVFQESQGAIICDLTDEKLIPALVRKSDGTSLYMTWDLALARKKFDTFDIERSLYVVASPQSLHFQQLFATLGHMGYDRAKDCSHVSYELVMSPDGKMSSRKGTATPFHLLRQGVHDGILAKMRELDPDAEPDPETARRIAIACLRYGMLRVGNGRKVVYRLEDWINPEGESGAYLLYTLARIGGIHRKTEQRVPLETVVQDGGSFGEEAERGLIGHLLMLPHVLRRVEEHLDPSPLAGWLYEGARAFSRFYSACPVLKADDATREARLLLVNAAQAIFERAFGMLGIQSVEAM